MAPIKIPLGGSSSGASKPKPTPKRPHAALGNDSDDEGNEGDSHAVTISHFDQNGAVLEADQKEDNATRVIKCQPNKFQGARKRQKSSLPGTEKVDESKLPPEEPIKYGLQVRAKPKEQDPEEQEDDAANGERKKVSEVKEDPVQAPADAPPEAETEDDVAMRALLGQQNTGRVVPNLQDDVSKEDDGILPEGPSLEDCNAMPVEDFGAAMLRGMGWKEGEGVGKNRATAKPVEPRVLKPRPALLGIGAKEDKAIREEFGSWGKSAKSGKKPGYQPVMMRNKETGEMISEADLKKKLESNQQMVDAQEPEKEPPTKRARSSERPPSRHRDSRKDADRGKDREKDYRRRDRSRDDRRRDRSPDDRRRDRSKDGRRRDRSKERRHRDRSREYRDKDHDRDLDRRRRDKNEDRGDRRERDRDGDKRRRDKYKDDDDYYQSRRRR